jgi:ankyrin repeat protein
METSPLAAVRLVLRETLADDAPDVVGVAITDFLVRDLTLRQACDLSSAGSTALLEYVWSRGLRAVASERWSVGKMLHTEPHYYSWAFTRAMVEALRRGDLAVMQWLRGRFPECPIYVEVLSEACRYGRLEALQLLHSVRNGRDFRWDDIILLFAAKFGHWDVIRWVREQWPDVSSEHNWRTMLKYALRDNNLEEMIRITAYLKHTDVGEAYIPYSEETWPARKYCVLLLLARGLDIENVVKGALKTAAEANDLEFVQWLLSFHVDDPLYAYEFGLARACELGHLEVARCLLTNFEELKVPHGPSIVMCSSSRGGQLAMVRWIYELYGRKNVDDFFYEVEGKTALEAAAENGHLEVVQFLQRIDVTLETEREKKPLVFDYPMCSTKAMDGAAGAGHLAVVKWLHTNRSEGCTTAAMDEAAANGHWDVVKWLHFNRFEGCTSAAMDAVAGRVYHEAGCRGTCFSCCADKRPESFVEEQITMLEWLKTNRTEGCTAEAVYKASRSGNLRVLQWLRANTMVSPSSAHPEPTEDGYPPIRTLDVDPMEVAASDGRLDIVKWLHGTYRECGTDVAVSRAMSTAALYGRLEVVKWLCSNLRGDNPGRALVAAAGYYLSTRSQLEVVRYLLPMCAAVDIPSAIGKAMGQMHFEIILLLHAQHPTLTSEELSDVKNRHRFSEGSSHEVVKWIEENYPFDAESE